MILFIDDEPNRVEVYARDLRMSGFEVLFKDSVDQALAAIQEEPALISLMILDVMLAPGESFEGEDTNEGLRTGINLYNRIRTIVPRLPVIILTNVTDEKVADWFQKQENCWFFRKKDIFPFEFTEEVRKILGAPEEISADRQAG